ncbi:hypothetical protein [Lysobacter gummosus]|uniref:hypothetical protein n=1 Tax=Lysobacter gummosus TaxID=262324 RepID=UPI003631B708
MRCWSPALRCDSARDRGWRCARSISGHASSGPRHRRRDTQADFDSPLQTQTACARMRRRSISLRSARRARLPHSHSIVAGGLPLMS